MDKPKTYTEAEVVKIILNMREEFSDLIHDTWSNWMEYILDMDRIEFQDNYGKWHRQMQTDYPNLSEEEKNSDRVFADKFISLINSKFMTAAGFRDAIEKSGLVGTGF